MICIVVAHPDDESMWFGGTLLRMSRKNEIIVICLTNASNSARKAEFGQACHKLGIKGFIADHSDGGIEKLCNIGLTIDQILARQQIPVDSIVGMITHAPYGNEHGHFQHKQCFRQVREWCRRNRRPFAFFAEKRLDEFNYRRIDANGETKKMFYSQLDYGRELRSIINEEKKRQFHIIKRMLRVAYKICRNVLTLGPFERMIETDIDLTKKQELLSIHVSQVQGLKEYDSYIRTKEYLYVNERSFADALFKDIICPLY